MCHLLSWADSSPQDRSTLKHTHLCLSRHPAAASSTAQLHTGRGEEEGTLPHLSPTCCLGSLPGPPLPSYHETLRFRTLFSSALHILVLLSHSSFLKQTQPLLGQSQPRSQGFSPHPHTASLGVPSSPATSPRASFQVQPALYVPWAAVNSVCQASGRGQAGLGSRHLPRCSAGWAQAGPLRPSPLPFCRTGAAASAVAAPAKGYGQSQRPVDGEEQFPYRSAKRSVSSKC